MADMNRRPSDAELRERAEEIADERASLLVEALTLDEMITLVHGPMPRLMETPPEGLL